MNDVRIGVELQLLLLGGSLARVGLLEDPVQLFECTVLGLGNQEVDDHGLDGAPDAEDDVCLPRDILKSNGESKLVDESTYEIVLVRVWMRLWIYDGRPRRLTN